MTLISIVLLLSALVPGLVLLKKPNTNGHKLKGWLIFAGAYIFSVTVIHLIPEVVSNAQNTHLIALFILLGFFMQTAIDLFTNGAEHGHIHHHGISNPLMLVIGLSLHALMDGAVLIEPGLSTGPDIARSYNLLIGIVLHKIPAALVLATIMLNSYKNKVPAFVAIILFSLASPLGMFATDLLSSSSIISGQGFNMLFALISGNFLHISTVIYYETNPGHEFKWKKFVYSFMGVLLAIFVEFIKRH